MMRDGGAIARNGGAEGRRTAVSDDSGGSMLIRLQLPLVIGVSIVGLALIDHHTGWVRYLLRLAWDGDVKGQKQRLKLKV